MYTHTKAYLSFGLNKVLSLKHVHSTDVIEHDGDTHYDLHDLLLTTATKRTMALDGHRPADRTLCHHGAMHEKQLKSDKRPNTIRMAHGLTNTTAMMGTPPRSTKDWCE